MPPPLETQTAQLLSGWHRGDSDCLEALVERHLPWLHEQVQRRMGPVLKTKGETCDYVQDAMTEFLRYGPRFVMSDEAQFRGLLLRIVENSLRNQHRWFMAARREIARERPLPSTTILALDRACIADKTPSQSAERHEQEAWVRLAMELLTPEDREVLVLRQWQKLSFSEIGGRFGISAHAATMRHHRAVRRLADRADELRRMELEHVLEEAAS